MSITYPTKIGNCLYPECKETQNKNAKGQINFFCNKHSRIVNEITAIIRFGKIEGKKRWKKTLEKRRFGKTKKGFIKNYGEIAGIKKWNDYMYWQKYRVTKEYCIEKHGEKEWKKRQKEIGKSLNRDYYLNDAQANYDLADWLLSQRQNTFSKEICIKKYGKKEGLKVWKERQDKWQNTLNSKPQEEIDRINKSKAITLKNLTNKYGEFIGKMKYKNWIKAVTLNFYSISKISNTFMNVIEKELSIKIKREVNIGCYIVDGLYENTIIEFYGDYWHCNPQLFNSNDYNKSIKMTAKEKWKKDNKRLEYLKKKGYDVIVVWEDDWEYKRNRIIKECFVKLGKL